MRNGRYKSQVFVLPPHDGLGGAADRVQPRLHTFLLWVASLGWAFAIPGQVTSNALFGTFAYTIKMPAANTAVSISEIVTDPYLQSVLEVSAHACQQCMTLIDHVEANAVATSQTPSPEVQLELSKQQKSLYSHLAQLRGANRKAINKVRNTKQTTAEARQEIDRLHLHLQNLYYEERHLRGEITACESYEYVLQLSRTNHE